MTDPASITPLHGVSAIVVTFHTGSALWPCLDALQRAPVGEIVMVDNGSDAATLAQLRARAAEDARIVLLSGHGNVGFAAGCNRGAAAARGAHLLFLNPDAVLEDGAIAALLDAARDAPAPCIVGGVLRDAQGCEQRGARRGKVTLQSAFASFTGLARFERAAPALRGIDRRCDPMPSGPQPMPVVSGALMFAARADYDTLGGFDEGYFLHVEDIDLCRRASEAGGGAIFTPYAGARHAGATSKAPAPLVAWRKARGFQRYFRKFARSAPERIAAEAVGAALCVLLPAGALFQRRR